MLGKIFIIPVKFFDRHIIRTISVTNEYEGSGL
jgi:hypothetical protein